MTLHQRCAPPEYAALFDDARVWPALGRRFRREARRVYGLPECSLVETALQAGLTVLKVRWRYITLHCTLYYITVHCSTLQYIAVHYSTLHYRPDSRCSRCGGITLHYITLHYIILQYITVH